MNEQLEPKEEELRTIKVNCYFTTYVTVNLKKYKDRDEEIEDIENQLNELGTYDFIEECDKIEIDSWEEV